MCPHITLSDVTAHYEHLLGKSSARSAVWEESEWLNMKNQTHCREIPITGVHQHVNDFLMSNSLLSSFSRLFCLFLSTNYCLTANLYNLLLVSRVSLPHYNATRVFYYRYLCR